MAKGEKEAQQGWRTVVEDERNSVEPPTPIPNKEDWITNTQTDEVVLGLAMIIKKLKEALANHDQYPGHQDLDLLYQDQANDNAPDHHA